MGKQLYWLEQSPLLPNFYSYIVSLYALCSSFNYFELKLINNGLGNKYSTTQTYGTYSTAGHDSLGSLRRHNVINVDTSAMLPALPIVTGYDSTLERVPKLDNPQQVR